MRDGRVRDKKPNVRRKYLSPDEARRVIEAAGKIGRQPDRDRLLLTMMFRHGLRLSEAIDLRWSDFDLESRHRTLFVRRLKGSKDAVHTLEPDTVRMLKRAKAQSDGNYVFRSERGGPLSPQVVQVIVARAGEVAGLPFRVHPHHFAARVRLRTGRGGHRYPIDTGLPWTSFDCEHGHPHPNQCAQIGFGAGQVAVAAN